MKKILLITFILLTARAYSQSITYGISAGFNYTSVPGNGNPNTSLLYSITDDYQAGFHVGGLIDIKFTTWSLQPGILFTTKGGQITDRKIVLDYVEVPVNFLYRSNARNGSFFIGGGPYVGIGTSGTYSYTEHIQGTYTYSENLKFGQNFPLSNPDIGINGLMGYQLKSGLAVSVDFGFGLTDAYNTVADNKNQVLSLSIAYFFKP